MLHLSDAALRRMRVSELGEMLSVSCGMSGEDITKLTRWDCIAAVARFQKAKKAEVKAAEALELKSLTDKNGGSSDASHTGNAALERKTEWRMNEWPHLPEVSSKETLACGLPTPQFTTTAECLELEWKAPFSTEHQFVTSRPGGSLVLELASHWCVPAAAVRRALSFARPADAHQLAAACRSLWSATFPPPAAATPTPIPGCVLPIRDSDHHLALRVHVESALGGERCRSETATILMPHALRADTGAHGCETALASFALHGATHLSVPAPRGQQPLGGLGVTELCRLLQWLGAASSSSLRRLDLGYSRCGAFEVRARAALCSLRVCMVCAWRVVYRYRYCMARRAYTEP